MNIRYGLQQTKNSASFLLYYAYEFKTAKLHYSYTETRSKQTHKNRHLGGL